MSNYGELSLSPELLPREYAFLRRCFACTSYFVSVSPWLCIFEHAFALDTLSFSAAQLDEAMRQDSIPLVLFTCGFCICFMMFN
jgi:hypothetical protein